MWNNAKQTKPPNGTIVEVETRRKTCSCGGKDTTECYFDNGIYHGIKNQRYVDKWRISPNNDILKQLEERKAIKPTCVNCYA